MLIETKTVKKQKLYRKVHTSRYLVFHPAPRLLQGLISFIAQYFWSKKKQDKPRLTTSAYEVDSIHWLEYVASATAYCWHTLVYSSTVPIEDDEDEDFDLTGKGPKCTGRAPSMTCYLIRARAIMWYKFRVCALETLRGVTRINSRETVKWPIFRRQISDEDIDDIKKLRVPWHATHQVLSCNIDFVCVGQTDGQRDTKWKQYPRFGG